MKDLQSILKKYPKALKSFQMNISMDRLVVQGWNEFLALPLEAQIGYILAWMRSRGYVNLTIRLDDSVAQLKHPCRIIIHGGALPTIFCDEKDFNTAFLSLTEEFCKQIEKQ